MKKSAIVLLCILFAACSTIKNDASKAAQTDAQGNALVASSANPADTNAASSNSLSEANDASKAAVSESAATTANGDANLSLTGQSVYFDYDDFTIKPEYQEFIAQQANNLKNNNEVIILEGHADERGSASYNLALGEKRASSVRKSLELLGIPAAQIKLVSYGNAKPKVDCHKEKCWHENRRVDFVLQDG